MRTIELLAVSCLVTGCGSLRVEVSVLNPQVIEREDDRLVVRQRLPFALNESEASLRRDVATLQTGHFAIYTALSQAYLKEAAGAKGEDSVRLARIADGLQGQFGQSIGPEYGRLANELVALNAEIRALDAEVAKEPDNGKKPEGLNAPAMRLALRLRQYDAAKEQVRGLLVGDTASLKSAQKDLASRQKKPLSGAAADTVKKAEEAAFTVAQSILAGRKLIRDSPYLHAIAGADERFWAKRYNDVFGGGTLGNVDVAIKLDDTGDFSLKGLTFDPSDIARAVAKAGTQALLLTAQVLGVPVTRTGAEVTGQPGAALAKSSHELAEVERTARQAEKGAEARDAALRIVAGTIVDTRAEWSSGASDATRAGAIAALRKIYEAQKPKLAPAASTPGGSDNSKPQE
jgi:hypothetical protein